VHERGARSLLNDPMRHARVVRLLRFGMDVEKIASLTGWALTRVRTEAERIGTKNSRELQRRRKLRRQRAWRRRQRQRGDCLFCSAQALRSGAPELLALEGVPSWDFSAVTSQRWSTARVAGRGWGVSAL